MSSRSGQPPVETTTNDLAKTDFGASASQEHTEPVPVKIDLSQSSAHEKSPPQQQTADTVPDAESPETSDAPVAVASVGAIESKTIPLPEPKTDSSAAGTRVVVTQGEQKTALTTGEEALRLMPPGPDFAAEVQKELARIGCYRGSVDNIWGPMSRNAVARFNRVAQSKLPLKQPTRALLSSIRKAPDDYCNGGGEAGSQVAALDPGAGLEDLKNRPSYLPPWMRGEPMPEPDEEQAEAEGGAQATPSASETSAREPRARTRRQERARARSRQVRQRRVRQRQARRANRYRSRSSFQNTLRGWPGSGTGR
ncbi:peptidoglycan-binding domain-containing protein [Dichotomicrobium thermohalophilum]|nr:peptidoglycan-binding domain-containing protein [Dichotomicrobium thermohalophilum]